ncbi:ATP-dependent zinc metalloprotease FtsH [uncultured Acetobacteroides sp.]|uniref:ATP-dependent zinc metalloprotease FtsH n=1 Tax=uncultured Acetobacteroides sp. TaxID=1760811 RepID=UPI0029F59235|nr:ATP-dependent zinc metalloprotease FtsH [uncultured Acetobacteroides sp.]
MDNNNKQGGGSKFPQPKFSIYWIYAIVALAIIGLNFFYSGGSPVETNLQKVKTQMLPKGDVERLDIVSNDRRVDVYIKKDRVKNYKKDFENSFSSPSKNGPQFYFSIGSPDEFQKNIEDYQRTLPAGSQATITFNNKKDWTGDIFTFLLYTALIIGFWVFIIRRMSKGAGGGGGGNIFNVGKSKAQLFDKENHVRVNFNDVAGLDEAKVEVMEIVDFLKNPQKYTELGGKIPKGALLVGPPGTGKTLLAKAVAGEANVPFFSLSGSDFVEMFVGVGASRVRDLFKQAKEKAPCIVFIDEIDAIGRARGKNANFSGNDERENTLNQLLTEMDGFGTNVGVIILAATNRADILDRALLRAGRFDRQIYVELPDLNGRAEIFKVHLRPLKLAPELETSFLAKQTPGFSGADIANVCNEAALVAARKDKKQVERQDFLDAIDRIIGGLEKKNKIISLDEKKTIAYHEGGHATVSWLLEYANPLLKVTIVPRGRALGAAWYLPEERQITTREQLMDELAATLGGRASEEIVFGKISTGALNDLERVTKQAYAMVSYYGMNKELGNLSFYDSTGQNEYMFGKPYSEKTAETIDSEVKSIIEEAYLRAKSTLNENREGLNKLSELLLEKEVIFSEDLEAIFGKRKGAKEELLSVKPVEEAKSLGEAAPEENSAEADSESQKENSNE